MNETTTMLMGGDWKVVETTNPATEVDRTVVLPAKEKVKVAKEPKPMVQCWCGCGGMTRGKFVPGHDARFHGWGKKVARGEMKMDEVLARLPHEESREEFRVYVESQRPAAAKWLEAQRAIAAAKESARIAKESAK